MMRPQPFHGYIGEGRIPPDQDSLLGSWQDGMGTACDRKSDAGRRNFGRASLYEKHDGNKAKHRDNQTEGEGVWFASQGFYSSFLSGTRGWSATSRECWIATPNPT